jgi:hypothetical protein
MSERRSREDAMRLEGGCLCGAVRYRIDGPIVESGLCHCRSCRLASGATPVAWLTVATKDLVLTAGATVGHASSPGVTRRHCGTCGTPLTYECDAGLVDVTVGTLDRPAAVAPASESWLSHRVPWAAIDPSRPGFDEGREDT